MKKPRVTFAALLVVLNLLAYPVMCHAKEGMAEVRIAILSPQTGRQEHTAVMSFRNAKSHAEFASTFQRINDAGLNGDWYLSKNIPLGEYEVRVSIGAGKPDAVRVVEIESRSQTLFFGSDVTTAHIVIVDPLGDILKDIVIDKVVDAFGTNYMKVFSDSSIATIPVGIYQVQAHARGYGVAKGTICFCQSESWAVLGVGVPGSDVVYPGATVQLRGIVKSEHPISKPMIVRLAAAYLPSITAAVVLPEGDGVFALSGAFPPAGDYILLVSQSGHVLGSGVLRLPLDNAISFRLKSGATISIEEVPNGAEN